MELFPVEGHDDEFAGPGVRERKMVRVDGLAGGVGHCVFGVSVVSSVDDCRPKAGLFASYMY